MIKKGKLVLPLVVVTILVMSFWSAKSLYDIRDYGKLINYVGIVRGASQRAIKLETNGVQDDRLIEYVSGIMEELLTGKGTYGLVRTDCKVFNKQLMLLDDEWRMIKDRIVQVRGGAEKDELLEASEDLFEIANNAVFAIDEYSGERSQELTSHLVVTAIACLLVSIIIIVYYVQKYFGLRRKTEELEDQAGRDELTGALNTERFCDEAQKIINENPDLKIAVQYIDFENFKYINDVFGYQYGDNILKKYTELMMGALSDKELFSRSLADRFVALRYYTDKQNLLERQKEIDKAFMELEVLPDKHTTTIACGFCCLEDVIEKLDVKGLINRANYAQKTVKNQPGEHYAFYDESIRQRMFQEIHFVDCMETALANKEFVVFLQPKVSPYDGEIKAAEALVRWQTADGEFYLPGVFIPVFEKNHLIGILDQYVFEEVCRFMARRMEAGKQLVPISINVSKIRFYTADFIKTYTEIKNRYNIPDGMLEIEFTETVACENPEYMMEIVKELHENGFLCSLDDFGTGYSSLGLLKDMSIDILKLDALFFNKGIHTQKDRLVIQGVLEMIHRLNIRTVAEGIEDKSQVEFLKRNGCDLIQGYYYFRPMPVEEFEKEIDKVRK